MPWCPNCKTEYQTGISVCSDCKTPLVDELKEDLIPFFQSDDKGIADKLAGFFRYSDLASEVIYDEESDCYIVAIDPDKQLEAKKLYQAFYFVERERIYKGVGESDISSEQEADQEDSTTEDKQEQDDEQTEESVDNTPSPLIIEEEDDTEYDAEADAEALVDISDKNKASSDADTDKVFADTDDEEKTSTYIMKADRYKDLAGTVWLFLIFGIAGIIFVLLNAFGILNIFSGWLPNLVMSALFIFFIYVAISTNNKAKRIKAEIAAEEELTGKINEWLAGTVTEDLLKEISDENASQELNYLKQTAAIKDMLIKEFGHQNEAYLDRLIEEYYSKAFDKASE